MPRKKNPVGSVSDLILDVFETKEKPKTLSEGALPITPFIAFTAFKRSALNALRSSKAFVVAKKIKETPTRTKAKAEIGIEKTRAGMGIRSGQTVYKLTKEQMDLMGKLYNKYGKEMAIDILRFRRSVLAPYQLIKRKISSSSRISSKDITGLSKEEYHSALESGRKKIQGRGPEFFSKSQEVQDSISNLSNTVQDLQKMKENFKSETSKIDYNIANKVFREFEVGDADLEGYSREELRKVYEEIMVNYRALVKVADETKIEGRHAFEKTKENIKKSRALWQGKTIDLTKTEDDKFFKRGSFNAALGKYFFSRDIMRQLTQPGVYNIFKKTYQSIIDEMIAKAKERKDQELQKLISLRSGISFTEKEKKVWGKLSTIKSFSGNPEDYYQKVKEGDFLEKPITVERGPELVRSEQKIENEIKKFERKLKSILDEDDFTELKRLRLIGKLILIKELKDPKNLFKSEEELKRLGSMKKIDSTEEEEPSIENKETPENKATEPDDNLK